MKKIKTKSIVIAAMALLLSGAVYVNWVVSGGGMTLTDLVNGSESNEKVLGTAELVNAQADEDAQNVSALSPSSSAKEDAAAAAFSQLRVTKSRTRDESLSTLKAVTEDDSLTADEKKNAVDTLARLADDMRSESNIENLVMAKGFSDCIAYIGTDSVTVAVGTPMPLTAAQAAQIKDIAANETNYSPERIKVVEVG